jgi:predicted DNA-binding transcriptional regulator AlpA
METITMDARIRNTLPETGFVRLPIVLAVYPVSKSTWWAGIKSGRFPAGVKLSEATTAWRVEDIRALIESAGVRA